MGAGSAQDAASHPAGWQASALQRLYGGIDAFNPLQSEQKRSLSLSEVLQQHDETHSRLIAYIQSAPDDQLVQETRFRRRLRLDTTSHYPIHTGAIREWRERSNL